MAAPEIQADDELKATGTKELAAAKDQLEKAIKRAFQHVAYLAQPDPDGERSLEQLTFDDEHSTSLDGTIVWKALAERDKVFDAGAVQCEGARPQPARQRLWTRRCRISARPSTQRRGCRSSTGETGTCSRRSMTRSAAGSVQIVDGAGDPVAVTAPNQVNLASAGLRLAKPKPSEPEGSSANPRWAARPPRAALLRPGGTTPGGPQPGSGGPSPMAEAKEQQVAFSFTKNLLGDGAGADDLAAIFKAVYQALDERSISYSQGTLQLVVNGDVADQTRRRNSRRSGSARPSSPCDGGMRGLIVSRQITRPSARLVC